MGKPKPKAYVYDPETNSWVKGDVRHLKGYSGEQSMGFYFGERGYFIVEGPSGAGGHGITSHGFDGVAFNPETKDLIIYDNKAYKKLGSVNSASAIERNLEQNMEELIERVSKSSAGREMPHSGEILQQLRRALKAVKEGKGWPKGVRLAISNASGNSLKISKKLSGAGIKWINHNDLRSIRRARYTDPNMKRILKELDERAARWEKEAAEKITEREARLVEKRVGKAVAEHGALFAEKRLPKIIAKLLLNKSAKAAAHRAATFIPVAGWAFDAEDAYHGVQDIFRGHTARGLAGLGLAVGSVAADFLNLGDAVSGVGGTALAIAAHGAIMAGQIGVEMERAQEKMDELQKEIADKGQLPPDQRLRDYYDLDDDAIRDLKNDFAKPDNAPEQPLDLPPLPEQDDYPPPPIQFHRPYDPPEPLIVPPVPKPPPYQPRTVPQVPRDFPCV
ncbi:MAG TPA: hypothetical protein VFB14_27395 [Bryobacteraceae bacterium]|nr:hypothetical protein [Bryobacteraceae bacterium]